MLRKPRRPRHNRHHPTRITTKALLGLCDGFARGDPQSTATLPAIVLTSVLVRLATWRAESTPTSEPARTRRWLVIATVAVALGVVVPWAAFHPVRVGDLVITDSDGSSTTSPSNALRTLVPGAGQRVDLAVETVAAVRITDVRPVVPDDLRVVTTRQRDASQDVPRALRAGDSVNPRFRLSFRRCSDRPARIDTVRLRFVRLGRSVSQTLPLPSPLTLRCERAGR